MINEEKIVFYHKNLGFELVKLNNLEVKEIVVVEDRSDLRVYWG